jgi:hypothetical protein
MMGTFGLPTLGKGEAPAFLNSSTCREWLQSLPMANPALAQTRLSVQLSLMNRYVLRSAERLSVLELLRESAAFVQTECARKFAARPLPLAPAEAEALRANGQLWQELCIGYQHCLEACLDGDAELSPQSALIVQRALWALNGEQLDLYRSAHETGPPFWRRLHTIYSAAEQLGAATQEVRDLLVEPRTTSVRTWYACILLMHAASPYELTQRQLNLVRRWLLRWCGKVSIGAIAPTDFKMPPLIVDIAGDRPGRQLPDAEGNNRWLSLDGLAHSLKKRIVSLQKGASPASLGLGDDCPQPACADLVRHVYERCCKGAIVRSEVRETGIGSSRLVAGLEAIYYCVAGKPFKQPREISDLSKRQRDEIALFGQVATRFEDESARQYAVSVEEWRIADQSRSGMRLARPLNQEGRRLAPGQLLGLQSPSADRFLLAVVRWAMLTKSGEVQVGIRLVPGMPQPIALRTAGLAGASELCRPGFLLPRIDSLQIPPSLICPAGTFRTERIVELFDDTVGLVKLKRVMDYGTDFERAQYEPA